MAGLLDGSVRLRVYEITLGDNQLVKLAIRAACNDEVVFNLRPADVHQTHKGVFEVEACLRLESVAFNAEEDELTK